MFIDEMERIDNMRNARYIAMQARFAPIYAPDHDRMDDESSPEHTFEQRGPMHPELGAY